MDAFSEQEKEAFLDEIHKIQQVLGGDGTDVDRVTLFSSEESDAEEYDDDSSYAPEEEESEIDDISLNQDEALSAWQTYDDVENDSTSDESDSMPNVLQKTQAAIQQTNANESFSSSTVSDKSFVKTQSCVVGVNEEESAITEESGTDTNSPSAKNDESHIGKFDIGNLEWALQLNRDYQEIVSAELIKIECALRNNRGMQAEVESRSTGAKTSGMLGLSFFARFRPTYFKNQFGQGPPNNEDSKETDALKAVHPFFKPQKSWKDKDRKLLAEGVQNQNLEKMTLDLQQKLNDLKKRMKDDKAPSLQNEVKEIQKQIDNLENIPSEKLEMSLEDLDFHTVSRLYLPERTEKECRIRWLNLEHPAINHSKWTKEEDTKLLALSKKYNRRHWEEIAKELGTQRTPVQCCQRFQRSLNKDLLKSGWTEEEDNQLVMAVNACTKGNWLQVADMLEGRTPMQCLNRYDKSIKPGLKKGQWSKEENDLLLKYVQIYGPGKWSKISEHIPGRCDTAVRERWVNSYDPSLKLHRKWSKKEDALLLQAVDKHGAGKWSKISKDVPGRNDSMCWRRWKLIQKQESSNYAKELENRRTVLNYFVHRKQDVPDVDFRLLDSEDDDDATETATEASTTSQSSRLSSRPYGLRSKTVSTTIQGNPEGNDESGEDDVEMLPLDKDATNCRESDSIREKKKAEIVSPHHSECQISLNNDEGSVERLHGDGTLLAEGERIIWRYKTGIASYIDTKKDLYLLKSRYEDVASEKEREHLLLAHFHHMEELANTHKQRKERDNVQIIKGNKQPWKRHVNIWDTVYGPINSIGARSVRPLHVGHVPKDLAPFIVLLEVFRIDYASIMQKIQANAGSSTATASASVSSSSVASSTAGATSTASSKTASSPAASSTDSASSTASSTAGASSTASSAVGASSTASSTAGASSTASSAVGASSTASSTARASLAASSKAASSLASSSKVALSSVASSKAASRVSASSTASASSAASSTAALSTVVLTESVSCAPISSTSSSSTASSCTNINPALSSKRVSSSRTSSKKSSLEARQNVRNSSSVPVDSEVSTALSNKHQSGLKDFQGKIVGSGKGVSVSHDSVPPIIPIAPNLVTVSSYGRLLLHRKRLKELASQCFGNVTMNEMSGGSDASAISIQKRPSFTNTRDYKLLSARFNAMFIWPLLLLTHEARNNGADALTVYEPLSKNVADADAPARNLPGMRQLAASLSVSVAPKSVRENREVNDVGQRGDSEKIDKMGKVVLEETVSRDSSVRTKQLGVKISRKKGKVNTNAKANKRKATKRKRIRHLSESTDASDNDQNFDSDFSDPDFESKNEDTLKKNLATLQPAAIGKESLRKGKKAKRR